MDSDEYDLPLRLLVRTLYFFSGMLCTYIYWETTIWVVITLALAIIFIPDLLIEYIRASKGSSTVITSESLWTSPLLPDVLFISRNTNLLGLSFFQILSIPSINAFHEIIGLLHEFKVTQVQSADGTFFSLRYEVPLSTDFKLLDDRPKQFLIQECEKFLLDFVGSLSQTIPGITFRQLSISEIQALLLGHLEPDTFSQIPLETFLPSPSISFVTDIVDQEKLMS
ncbi:MAG: hypothetical protein ACTSPV_07270 [Candidatus Hodarchaeales archaeon]